jgi:hypothetical protein
VRAALTVPPGVRLGDSVPIVLRLVNAADTAAEVALQGRPVAFDVVVTRADGSPVWRRLAGEVVSAILQLRRLGPGEGLDFQASWDQRTYAGEPVPAGDYLVTGVIPTDPPEELRTTPVKLRILP